MNGDNVVNLTKQEKVSMLFKYIEELNKLKQKEVFQVSHHSWWRSVASFPNDSENIKTYSRDRVLEEETENASNILMSVHKPEFQKCPQPKPSLEEWLKEGWDNYRNEAKVKEFILHPLEKIDFSYQPEEEDHQRIDEENKTHKELFTDNSVRVNEFGEWINKRNVWVEKQEKIKETRDFFTELYTICNDLIRDSETLELVVADGFILDRMNSDIKHPILLKRVIIRHDAIENTIYIEDTDVETELYTTIFQNMEDINLKAVNRFNDEVYQNDLHPLDRNDLPEFIKGFAHQLSSEILYSEEGVPDKWQEKDRLLLYHNPCYILRKKMDGVLKAIEKIRKHIDESGEIPNPIGDIVEGGHIKIPVNMGELSVEEQLASVGGESVDILLSKEANKEQLEIARRIEQYNAVLVQGPPGTGKTHTIANLLGHFLAQGKKVLVTSHTQKALSVLKEKVAPGLQSLCVSVLEESNIDMERSIDGITAFMGQTTSYEVKKEMESIEQRRRQIIKELATVRKKLFAIINQECKCIVYNAENISPSDIATYVNNNSEELSYIPGYVRLYAPLPLSFSELVELYQSNDIISIEDELEFDNDIPNPAELISPEEFELKRTSLKDANHCLKSICETNNWLISKSEVKEILKVEGSFGHFTLPYPSIQVVDQLKQYISTFSKIESWMKYCAVDGRKGSAYKEIWLRFIEEVQATCAFSEELVPKKFGKEVVIFNHQPEFCNAMQQLLNRYNQGSKIGKISLLVNKQLQVALNGATINGQKPQNAEDCELILRILKMKEMRSKCASYWDNLIAKHGLPLFFELDQDRPESVAVNYIPLIQRYLNWYDNEYKIIRMHMDEVGLPCDVIFQINPLDTEIVATEKILLALKHDIPDFCNVLEASKSILDIHIDFRNNQNMLQSGKRVYSKRCRDLLNAANNFQTDSCIEMYRDAYAQLNRTYTKINLNKKRDEYLRQLAPIAPQWEKAIREREGMHGMATVPSNIEAAWRWKQYSGIIENIIAEPFLELQKQSLFLSKEYRKVTEQFVENSAWYYLLQKTEADIKMKQALQGWKQTVKKIGKGTGKNAPMYRAEARKLMVRCQEAVPVWIMTISKALESLNPSINKFDVIIIDEASQSNISSLAVLYMGKKLIIVGDDKQVSPMGVGVETDKINALRDMYITNKIPNAHLYDAKTSIYDIAATTFQPLMLREHFRCVPEIINFSNSLSYDFKIKPLRDSSSSILLPAILNYQVSNGEKIGKSNPNEAKTIVALLKACIEQPEYEGKSFGVISLLGDDQVKIIQEEIYRRIDAKECSKRRILCGNASNFQGDERDIIFLSMVDCANGNGPIAKLGFGVDDSNRKRYNVACSRAKDQLWVVNSLDSSNDLKSGDIRKMLIDYSRNPESLRMLNQKVEEKSESVFESSVGKYLVARGYHLVQQWEVGAYRLDIVVVYGNRKMVIECDGDRYHSGESKIREDMERQTILERLGWRFIRIRGSEYFRNPEKTMEKVVKLLADEGIEPENLEKIPTIEERDTDLLQRVKQRAYTILYEDNEIFSSEMCTISSALDSKKEVNLQKSHKLSIPVIIEDTSF